MVFFVCEGCNESLKKNQVDKHAMKCANCWAVTCVDCNVTFPEDEYRAHTSCISEAQRYEGKLYRPPKEKTKKNPQEIWTEVVEGAASDVRSAPTALQPFVGKLADYGNVPRNERKFINFVKNSMNIRSESTVSELWAYLSERQQEAQAEQKPAEPSKVTKKSDGQKRKELDEQKDEESGKGNGKKAGSKRSKVVSEEKIVCTTKEEESAPINWAKAICKALKAEPNKSMATKKLKKQVVAALGESVASLSKEELKTAFKAELKRVPKVHKIGSGDGAVWCYGPASQ